ncbi:MAG: ABC transporter permease [Huintestinicola sp.]
MHKKINIALLVINLLILAYAAICWLNVLSIRDHYSSDSVKQLWDNDTYRYGQISLYLTPEDGLDITGIYSLRESIEAKFTENSIALPDGAKGRLWLDSMYAQDTCTIQGISGSCDAVIAGTGGDFFLFHPLDILHGSFYTDDDTNFDRVVIDKECSWQLFGALNTVGLPVTVGSSTYYVAAVVDSPDSGYDKTAYGDKPHAYFPYYAFNQIKPDTKITAYEICIPDPVKGFALGIMNEINPADSSRSFIKDQSGRFDAVTLFKGYRDIPKSVMITANASYPWFENTVRAAEIKAQMKIGPAAYMLIVPLLSAVYALFLAYKLAEKAAKRLKEKAEEKYQKKISEEYFKKRSSES